MRASSARQALILRPELRDLLAAFHPPLSWLQRPVLGRLLPPGLTLGGLAHLTGADPDALVAVCNLPGAAAQPRAAAAQPGVTDRLPDPPTDPPTDDPSPPWPSNTPVVDLDLRPTLAQGQEPFAQVMAAWRSTPLGGVLRLHTPFRPAPLIDLLSRQGALSHVSWADSDCLTSLYKPLGDLAHAADGSPTADPLSALLAQRLAQREGHTELDLRGLEPPLPLELALTVLNRNQTGDPATGLPLTLVMPHEPRLLYPRLTERGLAWTVRPSPDDRTEVLVTIQPAETTVD